VSPTITGYVYRDRNTVEPVPDPVGQAAGVWTNKFNENFDYAPTVTNAANGYVNFGGPTWQAWYPSLSVVDSGNVHWNNTTELQYYDATGLSVSSSVLSCTARYSAGYAGTSQNYASGMVSSYPSYTFTYGFAEARLKLSSSTVGMWPAFWMISSDFVWPPEIDIMEFYGNDSGGPTNTAWSETGGAAITYHYGAGVDMTQWHVFGTKWQSGRLDFYLDGTLTNTVTTAGNVPSRPMYIVANLAMTAANGTPNQANYPQSLLVDYIRVWQ
jgi:beta-glucanase (GH16 family)